MCEAKHLSRQRLDNRGSSNTHVRRTTKDTTRSYVCDAADEDPATPLSNFVQSYGTQTILDPSASAAHQGPHKDNITAASKTRKEERRRTMCRDPRQVLDHIKAKLHANKQNTGCVRPHKMRVYIAAQTQDNNSNTNLWRDVRSQKMVVSHLATSQDRDERNARLAVFNCEVASRTLLTKREKCTFKSNILSTCTLK